MIEAKEAIAVAKTVAVDHVGASGELEEIEREDYKGKDVWKITLSFPDSSSPMASAILGRINRRYKSFLVEVDSGQFVAMRIRPVGSNNP